MTIVGLGVEGAQAELDTGRGGRLASLVVAGRELLVTDADGRAAPSGWGCYPMAPWAGRIQHGRFSFDGADHQLPINHPPHAIHGTAFTSAWTVGSAEPSEAVLSLALGPPWPYPATLEHTARLTESSLVLELAVTSTQAAMPAMLGWHPWFRRRLDDGGELQLSFTAGAMYEIDDELIPTGRLVEPPDGPWDNTFIEMSDGPRLSWPGAVDLDLSSDCDHWTIYTEPANALCVEPQTAAPNAVNRPNPNVVEPGETMRASFRIGWQLSG